MNNNLGTTVGNNENVLTVKLDTVDAIYSAQMEFIKGGGLFISTSRIYQLGEEVKVNLILMEEQQPCILTGKVVWNTPMGAQGALTAGIGIQFIGENAPEVRKKISSYVENMPNTERFTDTM